MPKVLGGWGLKNFFHFSKALAAKVGWRIISTDTMWTSVMYEKYIKPYLMTKWLRLSSWTAGNSSMMWKALLRSLEFIRSGLAWKVGDGKSIQVDLDPWSGSRNDHKIREELCILLVEAAYRALHQIQDHVTTTIWKQGWLSRDCLNLLGVHLAC